MRVLFFLFILWALPIWGVEASAPLIRFVYGANRQGEIEPCGCQTNQTGGLNRVQTLLEMEKAAQPGLPVFLGDAGDTFFSSPILAPTRKQEEGLRARALAEGYRLLGVDALTPGERDFAAGWDTLLELQKASGAVFLAANLTDGKGNAPFEKFHVFQKGKWKIAVAGLVDETAFQNIPDTKVRPAIEEWKELLPQIRKAKPDVVVVLSHLGLSRDRELAQSGGMGLIFGSHSLDVLSQPQLVGGAYLFQPQNAGAQVGILDYDPASPGKSVHRLVDLGVEYERDNAIAKLMDRYKSQVRALAVESALVQDPSTRQPFVAHARFCRTCHQKQYDFWATTKHASAYLVLYAKNEHFDPECIGCHSLGFEEPGGYRSIIAPLTLVPPEARKKGQTPFIEKLMQSVFVGDTKKGPLDSRTDPVRYAALKKRYDAQVDKLEEEGKVARLYVGVQCEHCHGNRAGHPSPDVPTVKKVTETTCRKCHAPPNAPEFSVSMIAKVACPLSSRP